MSRTPYGSARWFELRAEIERIGLVHDFDMNMYRTMSAQGPRAFTLEAIMDTKRCAMSRRLKRIRRQDVRAMKAYARRANW